MSKRNQPTCINCEETLRRRPPKPARVLRRHARWARLDPYFCTVGCAADWAIGNISSDIGTVAQWCYPCGEWMAGESNDEQVPGFLEHSDCGSDSDSEGV